MSIGQNIVLEHMVKTLKETQGLVLLGMGGSHFADHSAEAECKKLVLDAAALLISEVLYYALPDMLRVTLIASQSGESGEGVQCKKPAGLDKIHARALEFLYRCTQNLVD